MYNNAVIKYVSKQWSVDCRYLGNILQTCEIKLSKLSNEWKAKSHRMSQYFIV